MPSGAAIIDVDSLILHNTKLFLKKIKTIPEVFSHSYDTTTFLDLNLNSINESV